jgi:CHAT domain-containing protein
MGDPSAAIKLLERATTVGEALRDEIARSSEGPEIQGALAEVYDALVLRLVDADQIEDAFAAAERGRAALLMRRLQGDASGRPTGARKLADELERTAPNAVLAAYYLSGSELLVFVLRAGQPLVLERRSLPPTLVDEAIDDFREEVRAGPDAIGETWLRLSQHITEPLAPYLEEGSVLVIAPHRGLHNLPIHALRLGDARIIERWPVAYLPSASSFPYLVATGARGVVPAAVIGAHFTEEAEAVAAALGVQPDLVGAEIDVEAALAVLKDTDIVHVSAHGFFSEREPDFSGWILRPSYDLEAYLDVRAKPAWQRTASQSQAIRDFAEWADSSILSASDLAARRVAATLVIASACESGVIAVDAADDPSGLVPALLEAGVTGVVATLWLVDAERTRTAMLELHDALAHSDGWDRVPRAVQRAALAVKKIDPHPYFWAPYVAIGGFAGRKERP